MSRLRRPVLSLARLDIGHDVGGVAEARLDPPGDYFFDLRPNGLSLGLYRR